MDYDVVVVGGGVTGSAIARYLSKYNVKVALVERNEDVCSGTSKANSGIVHSGYDPIPGTQKAKFNIRGAELIKELSTKLDFDYKMNGSIIICDDVLKLHLLEELYERGVKNGVKGLKILNKVEVHELEPNLTDKIVAALYCPTGGIVCPFGLTIALAENAAENGVEFIFNYEVKSIKKLDEGYEVISAEGKTITTKTLVNAAGLYADVIHNEVCSDKLEIKPGRGNYMLLDREVGNLVSTTVFQLPTDVGKGVLVTPTVHGNLMTGPTSVVGEDKEDTKTYAVDLDAVKRDALRSVKTIPWNKIITSFSGLRAHISSGDFQVGNNASAPGYYEAVGIDSPGLTSAPAIGEYLASMISKDYGFEEKKSFKETRKGIVKVATLSNEERNELIKKNPLYGVIVCRCEEISEGEIVDAINRPLGATSLDGVKRRVRAGMGRCQAGFCTPRTMEILAREKHLKMSDICKNKKGSEVVYEA